MSSNESRSSAAPADAVLQGLLTRSSTDPEFRARLLADPRGALAEHTGVDAALLPDAVARIRFVEEGESAPGVVVLPATAGEAELSETELETVSGGTIDPWYVVKALVDAILG